MRQLLEKIEKSLQKLIESSIQLLPWNTIQKTIAISIINGMRDIVLLAINNNQQLPNIFSIAVNPEIYETLGIELSWIQDIKRTLAESAEEYEKYFPGEITIEFFSDPDIFLDEFRINSYSVINEIEETAVLPSNQEKPDLTPKKSDAYLLFPNKDIFPLSKNIIQIGRKNDNHLVIDNPTISRNHAQIRYINGNYVIFDLNSTSGTFINGVRINQSIPRPGDVISVASYPLVYGEENNESDFDQGSTAEIPRIVDSK